jgi:transcriptional regulator with XRE-family HTH domain
MRLRDLRQKEGLTTYQIAGKLGINQGHYCHLENGTRKLTEKVAEKIEQEFGISKEALESDFILNNPHLDVLNSWIWKIKINEMPAVQSFINDIDYLKLKDTTEHSEVIEAFVKYIQFTIGSSIEQEFKKNNKMIEYLVSRLKK